MNNGLKLPPHNLEAERGVLGSVLLDDRALRDVLPILRADDFSRDAHRTIYSAARELHDRGEPVEPITLADELGRRGELDHVGGHEALAELLGSVPHAANAAYYARIVREKAVTRDVIRAAEETLRDAYAAELTAGELVALAERRALALSRRDTLAGPRPVAELALEALARLARRKEGRYSGIPTGLADLDNTTDGLPNGGVVLLAARPSMGKTALGLQAALHAARAGIAVLVVSLEMTGIELAERLLVTISGVDGHRARTGHLSVDNLAALRAAHEALMRVARFGIDDAPSRTVAQVAAIARREKARHGLGLLVLDYVQLVEPEGNAGKSDHTSRQEQVAAISRRLKTLARELDVPVLALSQLNRQSERREDRRPMLSDLRESGSLEQDADMVLLLHRPEFYDPNDQPGVAELIVAKNRNGATCTVKLTFLKSLARFESSASGNPENF